MMATRKGLVKKTELKAYSRPLKSGIIAIKLGEDDELIDVAITKTGDEIVLCDRRRHGDSLQRSRRPPDGPQHERREGHQPVEGRSRWSAWSSPIPTATLLTACENGYGKRTPFGPNAAAGAKAKLPRRRATRSRRLRRRFSRRRRSRRRRLLLLGFRYRTQRRGGKGLRDIKTTDRNGPVIGIVRVDDDDELMMMTARGKIQRVAVSDFNPIGRNTQGVRIMSLDEGDTLAAIVRVPKDEDGGEDEAGPDVEVNDDEST